MAKNFEKGKVAVLAACLLCALAAFLISRLATGATNPAALDGGLSASRPVEEIERYKRWAKVNPVPQLMPERVAIACHLWVAPGGVIVDGESNPHRDKYFTVYVNGVGEKAMLTRKRPVFPEGSVIVKEKLAARDSREPELLTVMVKQKAGFNPASGDWEYMVVDGTGAKMEGRGRLQNCQACHLANRQTDYIFRTYLPDDIKRGLK